MTDQPSSNPLDSSVNCPCGQKAAAANVFHHEQATVYTFLCDTCHRIIILGAAPEVTHGMANVNNGQKALPILIFAQKVQKILLPQTQLDVTQLRKQ